MDNEQRTEPKNPLHRDLPIDTGAHSISPSSDHVAHKAEQPVSVWMARMAPTVCTSNGTQRHPYCRPIGGPVGFVTHRQRGLAHDHTHGSHTAREAHVESDCFWNRRFAWANPALLQSLGASLLSIWIEQFPMITCLIYHTRVISYKVSQTTRRNRKDLVGMGPRAARQAVQAVRSPCLWAVWQITKSIRVTSHVRVVTRLKDEPGSAC